MISFSNINSGEVVYQRCVLVEGRYETPSPAGIEADFVLVETHDTVDNVIFPEQKWPLSHGWFKALLMLNPGENKIRFSVGANKDHSAVLALHYTPLLQTPPLHLAILVAKDSPLLVDCPPAKFGYASTAHSGLDAVIAKFRMTAYMWQAFTAAEMAANGLKRRSFRLDEEWTSETVTQPTMRSADLLAQSTAKVHLIRTDKTVAELRDAEYAQQNESGKKREELHTIFTEALMKHGPPFQSELRPTVAGLILDSTYDMAKNMIVAHAALGAHNPRGLSLGIFGSHLTYAWPRFIEEVADCLLDTRPPGSSVGNDNGECASMWEACAVGAGAFIHEVGHAFSAPHTTGIMARGYSKDWPKAFLSMTAKTMQTGDEGIAPVTPETPNECHWDIRDLLRFANLPHFRIPGEVLLGTASPVVSIEDGTSEKDVQVVFTCPAGIVKIIANGKDLPNPTLGKPETRVVLELGWLSENYASDGDVEVEVLALNGKSSFTNVTKLLTSQSSIRIPGSGIRLRKKSIKAEHENTDPWVWNVLLKKRSLDGKLVPASKIDLRVGCALDGAIVYYKDGTKVPCGPRGETETDDPDMGGHQARKMAIPRDAEIVKVAVTTGYSDLGGLRMTLSNGKAMGALNESSKSENIKTLVPDEGQKILGFYGASGKWGMCHEFGIITGPRDVQIPDSIYDMPELQNRPLGKQKKNNSRKKRKVESETEDDMSTSEDEDTGYDEY